MQDAPEEITIASLAVGGQPPGGFASTYLSYLLARASHVVASGFHQKLKTWKLSVPEYRVLACLTGAEGLGVGDLAAMAIMGQSRMTKILDRMERQGLVERRADTRDRRRVLIHLTAEGRARAVPMLKAAKEHETAMLAPLTPEERAMILKALDLLIREVPNAHGGKVAISPREIPAGDGAAER